MKGKNVLNYSRFGVEANNCPRIQKIYFIRSVGGQGVGVLVVVMGRGTIAGCLVPGKWDEIYQRLTERKNANIQCCIFSYIDLKSPNKSNRRCVLAACCGL